MPNPVTHFRCSAATLQRSAAIALFADPEGHAIGLVKSASVLPA